jgi:indole-3-glycerol phosphate synthase
MMTTYLDAILANHRHNDAQRQAGLTALEDQARSAPPTRDFLVALREGAKRDGVAVISEIKRRSPSKGDLSLGLDPAVLAKSYADGGASCLSVLTDVEFFGGSEADLVVARARVQIPVLRKDFTVSVADVFEARIMGADAILLIVAALSDRELLTFHSLALELGLDVLVEIHDEMELDRALGIGARLIGVNQRDLHTFAVDHDRARRVGAKIPNDIVRVAESGITSPTEVASLVEAGFEAILVGETLVTSTNPGATLAELLGRQPTVRGSMD